MPTYIATFYTDANYAEHEFKAKTPKQALAAAREMEGGDDGSLYFESYDDGQPVDEIVIRDKAGKDVALWLSEERRLRSAARDMLEESGAVKPSPKGRPQSRGAAARITGGGAAIERRREQP